MTEPGLGMELLGRGREIERLRPLVDEARHGHSGETRSP